MASACWWSRRPKRFFMARRAPGNGRGHRANAWRMIRKFFSYFAALAGVVLIIFVAYQGYVLVKLWWWNDHNPSSTAFMEARLGVMQQKNPAAKLQNQWVPYSKISNNLKRAILVAEDDKFVDHEGFDWEGMQKALEKNQKKEE